MGTERDRALIAVKLLQLGVSDCALTCRSKIKLQHSDSVIAYVFLERQRQLSKPERHQGAINTTKP